MSGALEEQEKVMSEETKELVVNDRRHHVSADAPSGGGTLMETLASAVQRGLPIETLNALMDFQERIEAKEARKAYTEAMSAAREAFLPLIKKHSGYADRYKHEKLDDVCDAVDDALSANGLTYRWKTLDLENGWVKVFCIMTHKSGHTEEDEGSGDPKLAADPKANMNGFQRRETAISYLKRSTLKSICGIAAGEKDDDTKNIRDDGHSQAEPHDEAAPLLDIIDKTSRDELSGLNAKVKAEAEKRKISQAAFGLVRAHYSARLNREKELANAE